MIRASIALSAALCLAACPSVDEQADFFLLEAGNEWTYTTISGGNGEEWTLQVQDATENPNSSRGDLWFYLWFPENANDPQDPDRIIESPFRSFNVSLEEDATGDEPIPIGYTYRFVGGDEGDRNEFFVKYPPADGEAYSESWSYEVESETGTRRDEYEVSISTSSDPVETGYGSWDNNILVHKLHTQINVQQNGDEVEFEREHFETWAAGGGLVRYKFVSVDEEVTEIVVRNATAFTE